MNGVQRTGFTFSPDTAVLRCSPSTDACMHVHNPSVLPPERECNQSLLYCRLKTEVNNNPNDIYVLAHSVSYIITAPPPMHLSLETTVKFTSEGI